MEWLTEDAFVPMVTGIAMFIVFVAMAVYSGERRVFLVAGGIALVTIAIVLCEAAIVTDKEEITEEVYQLAFHVQRNDLNSVLEKVDPNDESVSDKIKQEMPRYDFDTCRLMGITDFVKTGEYTAEVEFTVGVQVRVNQMPETLSGQRRVRLFYKRNPFGKWKVVDYYHSDPRSSIDL
ncbi:MAG: hypothetical protein AAFN77_19000 [Planctomycetota bacterium]